MPKLDTAKVDAFLKEKYGASTNKAGIDTAKVDAFLKEKYAAPDKEVVQQLKTSNSLRNMALGMQADNLHDQIGSIVRSNPIHAYNHLTTDAASEAMDVEEAVERYSYNPMKEVETEMPESVVVADKVEMRGDILRNKIKAEYGATDASEGYGVRAGKAATSLVEQLPKAEDGRYIIDGYEYTHPEAVSVMQQVVENTMHPDLWKTDASYRDHYSWLNHGKSYKGILDEQYASLSSKLDSLQSKIAGRIKKQAAEIGVFSKDPHMALIGISEGEGMNKLRKVNDLLTSVKKDNFWSGLDEGFDSIDAATLGISSFLSEVQMTKVLDKVYNGEPLTERDQIYYDLWEVEQELKDIRSVKGQSWWNTVGSSVGTSAEMVPSFFVGMGSVGNIFKMSSLPLKAGMQLVKNSAKKGAWEGIKKGVGATMKVAGRSLGNVAKAEAMGMIAAPFLPSTWSEVASKRGDQYSLENGKLVYKPKAMWKDIANAWIEQGNELASEFIGTRIGDILGAGASTFGRMLGLDRVANKIGISSQATKLLGYEKPQWLKVLQRNLGYTGPVAEPLSEVWGDVASNLMKEGLTGDGEFSQFKSKDYWTTTLAVSTIYGGSVAMATAPLAIYDYMNSPLRGMRKQRDGYLGMIKDKVLRNNLLSISSMGDIEQMSSALAHLDWGNMNKVDIAYGMDFIRADMAYKVMIGDAKESVRQEQYQNVVNDAYAVAYKGATGNTPTGYIVRVEAEDGSLYYVLRGSLDSASEDILTCLNEEGNVVPLHPSKIKAQSTASLEDFMADGYTQLFATQVEMERQQDIIRDYKALENPTAEDIARIMSAFGATQQNAGDTVTLVDGGTGVVQEFDVETGKYLVNVASNDGNTVMLDVPFYDILSNDAQIASAQSSRFAEQTLDDMDISLAQEESAEEMQEAEAVGDIKVGDIITTPNGTQGRVMGFNEGNVVVDENVENTTGSMRDAYIEEYSLNDIIKDAPSTEATTEVVAPQESMEASQPVGDIKIVPVQEDGSVDYDAITDASQFAELYTKEIGSREEATNEVIAMRDALTAQIAENAKKTQKATTPNERVKMRKAANALAERVAFYNKVLEMLAPQEEIETPVEPIVEDAAAVEVDTPREVGIIENEYSERLLDAEKKVYNAMAEALGLTVEFVKEVVEADGTRANAKIDGNKVIVGWRERDRAISFLIGHEFLHRMRDLAPETYEMFKRSVQTYKGETRWNKDLARMQARYRAQNKTISTELLEEEVIADFTGELVEKKDVFSSYIEANKGNKTLLDKIAEVFRAIRDFLRSKGVEDRKLEDVVSALNNLIAEATAKTKEGVAGSKPEKEDIRHSMQVPSLLGVHNISLDKLRKVIKMGGLANPSVAVIDVDKQSHEDYGEYSLILPKNMVDARQGKNAGTWAGDAWTPTYPQIIKRIKDEKSYSRFHTDIEALPEAMRNKVRLEFDSFMEGRSADPLAYWYLFEKGPAPELVLVPSRYSDDITNAVSEATKGSFSMYGLTPDERAKCVDAYIAVKFNGDRAAFEQEMQERINRLTETLETKKSDRVKKWAQDTIDAIKEYGFDYDAVADFIRDVGYDAREKGTVNDSATTMAAREQIKANNLEADYEAWLNSLEERYGIDEYIFDGYTNSGNRRYLPHTLENVSKWMKKQGRQGAVATFPSFGVFIATAIPKMTSLESIRKRKALLGKSKEEYDAFREKWGNVYFELGKRLQPDAKGFDDYGYWRLIEAVGKSNPKEFIKKEYGIEMSEEDMAMFNDMVNAIRTEYPARYFETKFERPLQLSDFTAAVVPNDIPLDVESRLKDAGVEVIEYEKGDNASRAEAMQKASQMENVRFSLMDDAQAAAEVAPYLEAYNNDLVTFNALVNKVKDVAEKYPNATWPERFIKENYEDENEEDFINRLKWTISNYAVEEEEKVYSAEKQTIEETFGGIWIEDRAEFAKFVSAVNTYPTDVNGEGIAKTSDYLYLYYRGIGERIIPFASVYLNKDESQNIANELINAWNNGEKGKVREYIDGAYEVSRDVNVQGNILDGTDKELSATRENDRLGSELSQLGRYYYTPELYSKVKRADSGSRGRGKVVYSLITPEMDASYLDAVKRGDMAIAQRMVMEAAKLAIPNTKVVDEDGNPKVVYHGTPNNFNAFSKEMFGTSTDRGIWGNGFYFSDSEQYAKTYEKRGDKQGRTLTVYLNVENPLFISLRNGGNEGAMYFHELMEKHFTDDIYEDATRTDELMSVAQERLTADIVADGYDGIVVEYTNHIDTEYVVFNPNQIKSADPVTYDDAGNVIPLSERFNPRKVDIRYSVMAPTFYSNAEAAVRTIKQEKATPEQWLKMIEKNGGLKAGEDKWLGLSDWLKASDKKTLTKDEVLQYIAENDIQIEEVSYGDVADISKEEIYESAEFAELREGLTEYDEDDNPYINRERYDELRSESYDFVDGFSLDYWGEELEVNSPAAAATYLGLTKADREINSTRLDYTTKGLANKREIALVVPTIEPYNQSDEIHFGDAGEGRAVAWIRFGETTDADGKRVLVIDEIQSKRHQDGRENGYKDETAYRREKAKLDELEAELFERRQQLIKKLEEKYGSYDNYLKGETRGWRTGLYPNDEVMTPEEIAEYNATDLESNVNTKLKELKEKYLEGVPSAPFEKNWAELAFKRMLRYAAENGYDYVAWTTGDQQAERYNIGNVIERVVSYPVEDNMEIWIHRRANERIHLVADNNGVILNSNSSLADAGTNVSEVLGKDLSQRIYGREGEDATIYAGRGKEYAAKEIAVDGLRIGGEGMRGFYDQMLPSFVKKYTKKWGAEVKDITMPELEENNTMHAVNVTDSMRESVMQGQPKFSLIGEQGASALDMTEIEDALFERARQLYQYCGKANMAYGVKSSMIVAATREDFVNAQLEAGYAESDELAMAAYLDDDDIILLNSEEINTQEELAEVITHENAHSITHTPTLWNKLALIHDALNKDDIRALQEKFLPDYDKVTTQQVLDEIISNFVAYLSTKKENGVYLLRGYLMGDKDVDTLVDTIRKTAIKKFGDEYAYIVDALLPILSENLKIQKERYERKEGSGSNNFIRFTRGITTAYARRRNDLRGSVATSSDGEIDRRSKAEEPRRSKGEVTPRFALRDGGITLGDNKDIESIDVGDEGVGSTTEEQVRTYLKHKHYTEVDNIRKKYKRLRDIARTDYKERMKVRMDRIGTLRTNAAKIEYILGENEELALPLEHQALVRIARGEIRIKWENSEDGRKRGLAAEVGLKDGEKRLYASLTKDATLYFDEAVHQWWQMIGGYEREVDTQDLRNALIEALSEAHSPSMAITLLRNIYNAEEAVYDEAMALYEHEEAKEIAEEQSRYDEDIAEFEANKDAMIREYEERASFFDAISAMEGTILDLRKRIDQIKEKASRRVSNIQAQYREMRELIARTKAAVKEVITSDNIRSFQSSELRRLINKVDKARSIYEVDNILVEVQSIMLDVSIRTQRMDMDRMLKLRLPNGEAVEAWVDQQMAEGKLSAKEGREILDNMWKGKNASGVSVAKRIDPTTTETLKYLRKLISPTAHTKMVEDEEAAEPGTMVRKDGELELSQNNITQNEARMAELEVKKLKGEEIYTSADAEEYTARSIYDLYLRAVMKKQDIQTILEAIQDVKEMYYGNPEKKAVRDHHIESLRDEIVETKKQYLEALKTLNEEILNLMREGRDALRTFRMAEQAHKEAIVKLGLDALGVSTRIVENTTRTMPRVTAFLRSTLNAPYYTFQTTLKEIDHLAPNGEGEFYNHFMFGMQQCSDNFYIQHTAHIAEVAQKMRVLLGKKGKKDATLIADVIEESDSKIIATITYGKGVNRGEIINPESYDLTISNAMYLIAMWRQPMYRNSMMAHGITQEAIDAIYDAVDTENKGYIPFMNWVNDTFLPDTRLLYDKVHKAMFGASMAKERNYFPARVIGYEQKQDISLNEVGMLPSTITGAIVQRERNTLMPDIRMNYFKILMGHLQDMDQFSSYGPMIRDLNALCNNTLFREKCNKVMPGVNADGGGQGSLFQSFKTTAAIAVNCYRPKKAIADDIIMTVLRGWAGSNIAFRGWTAIKQLTSSPVFALYMLDGKCQELYLRNMGYGLTHMRKLHEWALENSPSYKQRWESKFAGMDVFTKKVGEEKGFGVHHKWRATKAGKYAITFDNAMRKFAVDLGLTPNAAVDAFTVMTGIKTIYDYELQKEMERDGVNTPTEGMKKLAMLKAEIAFNSTQQSGENVYLSQLQKERTFATSVLTVYLNSSFGFHRLRVTGAQELWKQMTDAEYKKSIYEKYGDKAKEVLKDARKKATSQILQGVVGDLLFAVMSGGGTIGIFTMFGDGDDEGEIWEQTKKALGVGVVNILTGGYMGGSILASALQGYEVSLATPFEELVRDFQKAYKLWQKAYNEEVSYLTAFGHTMNIISKYRYGLDFETLANTVAGVQGLIEGSGGNESVMNILNVPQSQIAIIAGRRRPEETSSEYVTRIMRMESIIQAEDGSKRERELQKQYEMAYRKNVVVRTSGASVWREMVSLEDDYKDITKELGWTANATPNEKAWETGMYVAPAEGISEAEYLALAQLEAEIAALEGYITHFEGTEDNYYNLVQRVTGVKKQFIEQYEQFK